jgi:hypothetical protein
MNDQLEDFEEVKEKGESLYKSLEPVYCPYFKNKVHFTAEGLEHLKFKRKEHSRPRQDQYMRFKLLKFVPGILSESKTLQGLWETKQFEKARKHSRTETVLKNVTFYEFIAVVENIRIKVIVKQSDGPYLFWSIIPFWKLSSSTSKRKLHSGNLDED